MRLYDFGVMLLLKANIYFNFKNIKIFNLKIKNKNQTNWKKWPSLPDLILICLLPHHRVFNFPYQNVEGLNLIYNWINCTFYAADSLVIIPVVRIDNCTREQLCTLLNCTCQLCVSLMAWDLTVCVYKFRGTNNFKNFHTKIS